MYFGKRKNGKAVLAVAVAAVILLLGILVFSRTLSKRREKAIDMSGQEQTAEVLTESYGHLTIRKSGEGEAVYNPAAKLSENSKEAAYSVLALRDIELTIFPKEGWLYDYAEVTAEDGEAIAYDGTEDGIEFQMPDADVTVTVYYTEDEEWLLARQMEEQTEDETETEEKSKVMFGAFVESAALETETAASVRETEVQYNTYNLKLYNATAKNTKNFGNPFTSGKLLQNIVEDFSMGNPASYYYDIGKVTFSDKEPEQEEGIVKRYLYFEDDPDWLILGTYYPVSDTYSFEDTTDRVAMAQSDLGTVGSSRSSTDSGDASSSINAGGYTGSYSSGGSSDGGSYSVPQTVTTTVSLNLQNVSTVLLSFIGNDQGFINQVTDYVYGKGVTGNVTGNFLEYTIDPEAQTAIFSIALDTGGLVYGTYDKNNNTYSFNGL